MTPSAPAKIYTPKEWTITNGATQSPSYTLSCPANGSATVELTEQFKIAFVKDKDDDHTVDETDPLAEFARIGHWGADRPDGGVSGYYDDEFGTVRNISPSGGFIDRDPERFYLRVVDSSRNQDAYSREVITVKIGTLFADGTIDDDLHEVSLKETGRDTGIFISESQLLVSEDLPLEPDDDEEVWSDLAPATDITPADDQRDDRTHRATVDGLVKVEYQTAQSSYNAVIPVNQRSPDERRTLNVTVNNFTEPWQDVGYDDDNNPSTPVIGAGDGVFSFSDNNHNGKHDVGEACEPFIDISSGTKADPVCVFATAGSWGTIWTDDQVDRIMQCTRALLAQARIWVKVVSRKVRNPTHNLFAQVDREDPNNNTLGFFDDFSSDLNTTEVLSRDTVEIQAAHRSVVNSNDSDESNDFLDIYFLAPIVRSKFTSGVTLGIQISPRSIASWRADSVFNVPNLSKNYINQAHIGLDAAHNDEFLTVAHEIMHLLTNRDHQINPSPPAHVLFPRGAPGDGHTVIDGRRLQEVWVLRARKWRDDQIPGNPDNLIGEGSRLLRTP